MYAASADDDAGKAIHMSHFCRAGEKKNQFRNLSILKEFPLFLDDNKKWLAIITENKVYFEGYDDSNLDIQPKRQIRGVNLSLFRNDQSSIVWTKVFAINMTVIHTGT